jgi:ribosomal protein S18 acetylase RimI-like enzyme
MAADSSGFAVEPLGGRHDRSSFACGVEALDLYFRERAGQDMRRRLASCFVLVNERQPQEVFGYYTLAATGIDLDALPEEVARKLPRYPRIPATLLGRLAIASNHRGRGLGELLLFDAFARSLASDIASFAFVVDPIDEAARRFYERYRFLPLSSGERRHFLAMSEIAQLF